MKTFEQLTASLISHMALKSLFSNFDTSTCNAYRETTMPRTQVTNRKSAFKSAILFSKKELTADFNYVSAPQRGHKGLAFWRENLNTDGKLDLPKSTWARSNGR